jgi:hypothetical protein
MNTKPIFRGLLAPVVAVSAMAFASPSASAAPNGSDLVTSFVAPSSVRVGDVARYEVRVVNNGNRNSALPTTVTIQLPTTATTPTPRILGTVSNLTAGCSVSGTRVVCSSPLIPRFGGTAAFAFDMVLPYSLQPISFRAEASTTNERNAADNVANHAPATTFHTVPDSAPANLAISHCTGTNLISFWDCVVTPTSTSSHVATLLPGGTIDLSANGSEAATMGGTWSVNGTQLTMTYTDGGVPVGTFVGQGTSPSCWEGPMTFPNSTYMSMYRVCR